LDRREWLDKATAGIQDPEQARAVREELDAHLSALVADLEAAGRRPAEAEAEALSRMGDVREVSRTLAGAVLPRRTPLQRGVLIASASLLILAPVALLWGSMRVGSIDAVVGRLVVAALACAGVAMAWAAGTGGRQPAWTSLGAWLTVHRGALWAWSAFGLLSALGPLRYLVPAIWDMPDWPWWNLPYFAAVVVPVVLAVRRSPDVLDSLAMLAVGLWPFTLVAVGAGVAALSLHPGTPSAFAAAGYSMAGEWALFLSARWQMDAAISMAGFGFLATLLVWGARGLWRLMRRAVRGPVPLR
jgi:hypothetical protein